MISAGIHGLIFLALFFIVAWRAPDPPLPEYGIELNFGLDDQGSGDVQPDEPVGENGESTETETAEQSENSDPTEVVEELKEPVAEKVIEQAVSKVESPITAKEKQETKTTQETKKRESTPVKAESTEATKNIPTVVAPAETPKKGEPGSQGDNTGKTGDKGSAEGTPDPKGSYSGTPGGGGGGTEGLRMDGWDWASKLEKLELPDNNPGFIKFQIECDDRGEITRVFKLEGNLSDAAEKKIIAAIRNNSLDRTKGGLVPPTSIGQFTFRLKIIK